MRVKLEMYHKYGDNGIIKESMAYNTGKNRNQPIAWGRNKKKIETDAIGG